MKCPSCGEEIVLAKTCPYCGKKISETGEGSNRSSKVRGKFRGPLRGTYSRGRGVVREVGPIKLLRAVYRLMKDPEASMIPKAAVVLAVLYLLYPLDIIPDLFIGIGWLDDAAVLALVWRYLSDQLRRYLS